MFKKQSRSYQTGLTWIELLVTLAICGVLLSVGTPSLKTWYVTQSKYRMLEDMKRGLAYARTEAFLQGETLVLRPTQGSTDWSSGMQLQSEKDSKIQHVWHWRTMGMHLTWHGFLKSEGLIISPNPGRLAMNGYFLLESSSVSPERWVVNRFGRIRVM